jgi:hypothetical protein
LCFCFKNFPYYSFSPILNTCPAHLNCHSSIFICSGGTPRFLLIVLFLILSRLLLPTTFRRNLISIVWILLLYFLFSTHTQ